MELIPTLSREKIPRGFSYPIGAEVLSMALADVPQFSQLQTHFLWKDTFRTSEYNDKVKRSGKIELLAVKYSKQWSEWTIWIHAVPRAHSHKAREQLRTALPALVQELTSTPQEPDHFEWKASYDLSSSTLAAGT